MSTDPINGHQSVHDRMQAEMIDSLDEELELEIDDHRLDALTNEFAGDTSGKASIGEFISRSCFACRANW